LYQHCSLYRQTRRLSILSPGDRGEHTIHR